MNEPSNLGELLAAKRASANLSIADAANKLHLKVNLIEKIEGNRFHDTKLAPIFLRGYIRSYGKLVGIPEQIIDKALDHEGLNAPSTTTEINDDATTQTVVPTPQANAAHDRVAKITLYVIVVALLIILALFWHHNPKAAEAQPDTPEVVQAAINETASAPTAAINTATISAALPEQGLPEENLDAPHE